MRIFELWSVVSKSDVPPMLCLSSDKESMFILSLIRA